MALTKITSSVVAVNSLTVANIADNAVDATKIASNSILTRHIDDNQIGIDQLNVSDGSSGQALTTDGSGTLSFASAGETNRFPLAGGTLTGALTTNGVINTGTSHNFAINTPNSLRINIDSNDSATDQVFVIGHNQTAVDNTNSALMTILESGVVGIGTTSPTHHLHVNAGSTNVVAVFESSDTEATVRIKDSTGTAAIKCRNDFRFNKSETTEMMRLNNDGKLIIGDTGSHVDDLLQIETPASGGGTGIQIRRNDSNSDQGIGRVMFGNNTDTDLVKIQATTDGATDSGRITIETQATGGASTEKMRIDSDGMWRGELLNNDNTNPLGSGTNSGKLWSTSGNYINVWQVTNDAVGAHYWIEIDIQSLDGYTSYGEIYKDRNGRWRIVQHRQAGTNFQVSSDNNYIQVTQSSGANQTNSSGNLKLVRIPGATA